MDVTGFGRQVEEEKTIPHARRDGLEAVGLPVEIRRGHGMAGCDETAVGGCEGEGVIGAADQPAHVFLLRPAKLGAAVRAAVVPGRELAIGITHHDDRGRAECYPAHPSSGEVRGPAHHHPLAGKNRRHLMLIPGRIHIGCARQAFGAALKAGRKRVALHQRVTARYSGPWLCRSVMSAPDGELDVGKF